MGEDPRIEFTGQVRETFDELLATKNRPAFDTLAKALQALPRIQPDETVYHEGDLTIIRTQIVRGYDPLTLAGIRSCINKPITEFVLGNGEFSCLYDLEGYLPVDGSFLEDLEDLSMHVGDLEIGLYGISILVPGRRIKSRELLDLLGEEKKPTINLAQYAEDSYFLRLIGANNSEAIIRSYAVSLLNLKTITHPE